ncbi:AraC family transcriptional regulator [Microlunatus endophyticus]|uniref:HTH-type transcriptional regulator RipA n=1 Tax=Microlunatus endophyticus TaxID=1716077 RepID=A0A917W7I5_9ACTN|nr:helix-turn-helix transcriptional regulator [Microlunatus endophyticus]GGL72835.1 AraC family transcriptional regulator [Microlunatus endophyticus]
MSAIGVERFDMLRGEAFNRHVHSVHQLAWARTGVLTVDVTNRYWVLPTTLGLWIPAGTWHATAALRNTVMQSAYVEPDGCALDWAEPTVVAVSPLAAQLIEFLAGDPDQTARGHAEALLLSDLRPASQATIALPLPTDRRARDVADQLLADPTDQRSLDELARAVGSSARTLLRVFSSETGLTFNQWRVHARLQAAVGQLAQGEPVSRVARLVGYATPSAFVAAFRRVTGHTPASYFGRPPQPVPTFPAAYDSGQDGG